MGQRRGPPVGPGTQSLLSEQMLDKLQHLGVNTDGSLESYLGND